MLVGQFLYISPFASCLWIKFLLTYPQKKKKTKTEQELYNSIDIFWCFQHYCLEFKSSIFQNDKKFNCMPYRHHWLVATKYHNLSAIFNNTYKVTMTSIIYHNTFSLNITIYNQHAYHKCRLQTNEHVGWKNNNNL